MTNYDKHDILKESKGVNEMLKEWWSKVTDPRTIISKGSVEQRRKTCPECGQVADGCNGYEYRGILGRCYDIYKCKKCNTKWRTPRI